MIIAASHQVAAITPSLTESLMPMYRI